MKRIILTGASDGLGKAFGKLFVSIGGGSLPFVEPSLITNVNLLNVI